MAYKAKNDAFTTLAADLSAGATSMSLAAGTGDRFPTITGSDYTKTTLENAAGDREIVHITARAGGSDTCTIVRAQEGTTALAWVTGDAVECRPTAALAEAFDLKWDATLVHAATAKTSLANNDEFAITDSAASYAVKRITWTNVKNAIWSAFGALIAGGTAKSTPVDADTFALCDSAASNATRKVSLADLKTIFGALYMAIVSPGTAGNVLTSTGSAWASSAPSSSGAPTGSVFDYVGSTAPTGYVLLSGRTIGSASSGATERANADTQTLYELLWNSMTNTEAPVSGGRGASATADFTANKAITLPDARGRVIAGKDNMGGTTASRLTSGGAGITGTTLGTSGGSETHTLTTAQLAAHTHTIPAINPGGSGATGINNAGTPDSIAATLNSGSNGSGSAHQNTQPTLVLNKIIKL